MTEFGLKRRYPKESLTLDEQICLGETIVGLLTNFQVDAIRFLWQNVKNKENCIFNDGRHMGKRIVVSALLTTLIRATDTTRVLIACESEDLFTSWRFKLQLFDSEISSEIHVFDGGDEKKFTNKPISFINFNRRNINWRRFLEDQDISLLILDLGSSGHIPRGIAFHPNPQNCSSIVISSAFISEPQQLDDLFKGAHGIALPWPTIRRTVEEFLREFPWMDQNRFKTKFDEFSRPPLESELSEAPGLPKTKDPTLENPVHRFFVETQEMSQLLFETDDESEDQQLELPVVQPSYLIGSMNLRVTQTQSFANFTPKRRSQVAEAETVQDSPDLFATIDSVYDEEDEDDEDIQNAFDISTPLSAAGRRLEIQSQSPIPTFSSPARKFSGMVLPTDDTLVDDRSELFEITSNDVFANRIKVTTDQKHEVVLDEDEQLKFDTPVNPFMRTPPLKRNNSFATMSSGGSGSSSGWLSKRGPRIKTPEKVMAKKRKCLKKFYGAGSGCQSPPDDLDFTLLDEAKTQKWNAC